jgi:hypothetical protein
MLRVVLRIFLRVIVARIGRAASHGATLRGVFGMVTVLGSAIGAELPRIGLPKADLATRRHLASSLNGRWLVAELTDWKGSRCQNVRREREIASFKRV